MRKINRNGLDRHVEESVTLVSPDGFKNEGILKKDVSGFYVMLDEWRGINDNTPSNEMRLKNNWRVIIYYPNPRKTKPLETYEVCLN
ncbi:hypothetical protein COU59_02175 [Candidatus Pacearchaeota archaeon CG10_big_fil_rev_8_21_14_0_10_34_12]|nr:MAG: hypothetical protein COU59_02175 [Candidatus Pacearchaeota archaeon CG10_big_fil_rev_8_21_14_0_10_34_12]